MRLINFSVYNLRYFCELTFFFFKKENCMIFVVSFENDESREGRKNKISANKNPA